MDDKRIQELLEALEKAGQSTAVFKKRLDAVVAAGGNAVDIIDEMEKTLTDATAKARGLNTAFTDIRQNLAANLSELAKTNSAINTGRKAYKGIVSIVSQLADEESGINSLSQDKIQKLHQQAQIRLQEVKLASDQLAREHRLLTVSEARFEERLKELRATNQITQEEEALLRARRNGFDVERRAVELTGLRLEKEKLVTKSVGLTGAALSGVGKILETLGLSGLSGEIDSITAKIKDDMRKEIELTRKTSVLGGNKQAREAFMLKENERKEQEAIINELESKKDLSDEELVQLEEAKKLRQEAVDTQEDLVEQHGLVVKTQYEELSLASKINHLRKGAADGIKKAFDKIGDPGVIFAFVGKALLEGSSRAAKLQKELTISKGAAEGLKNELALAANLSGSNFITSEKLTKSFLEMSKYVGQSAHMLGGEALVSATYLTEKMHLSADAAGQLVTMTRLTGRNTEETFKGMGKTLTTFNLTNKTAFSLKDIMNDIGNMSKATVLTLGKSPTALLKAAAAARKLGVSMEQLESIGDSLLDFETSIEKELEAQLLTGNALNLSRARELAMMGDMEGLANEIGNQEAIKNAFATKNVIAQKAAAEALGMSREELAKMTYQQELNAMGADKFKAKYGEVAYESAKAQSAQDKFTDAIAKMQSILGDIIGMFSPILDALAWIVANPIAPYFMAAAVAVKAFGGNPFKGIIKGIGAARQGLSGYIKDVKGAKGVTEKVKSMLGLGDKTGGLTKDAQGRFRDAKGRFAKNPMAKTMDKGAEATGKMQQKTKGAKDKGPKGFLKSLGDGLAHIGKMFKDVIKGALALGIAGVAIGGSFALALKMVEGVDPKTMLAFSTSIGLFAGSLYLVSKVAKDAIKGAAAMAIVGVSLIPAAKAFQMMAGVEFGSVAMLSGALILLGGAAAFLGKQAGGVIKGAVALGILGLALVPAASAFSLLEGVDTNNIIAFSIALPLLALAAAGLGLLFAPIIMGSIAIAALGAAMIPLAGAFALLGAVDIQGVLGSLGQFAAMTPGLLLAGPALLGLSAGLIAFSAALAGGSLLSGLTGLLGGGVLADLQTLADMAQPLSGVAMSLTAIASGLAGIALALSTLETEKINELKGLVMTTAFAAPMVAATGAITDLISGIAGGGDEGSSNAALEAKLDELIAVVKQGGDVYIDGNKAGTAMMLAQYKTA